MAHNCLLSGWLPELYQDFSQNRWSTPAHLRHKRLQATVQKLQIPGKKKLNFCSRHMSNSVHLYSTSRRLLSATIKDSARQKEGEEKFAGIIWKIDPSSQRISFLWTSQYLITIDGGNHNLLKMMPALFSRGGVISLFPLSALIFSSRCAFFSPDFFSRVDFLCVHLLGGFLLCRSRAAASGDPAPRRRRKNSIRLGACY